LGMASDVVGYRRVYDVVFGLLPGTVHDVR